MINILMPMAGKSLFFDNPGFHYPKPLIEIQGKTMVELAINNYRLVKEKHKFIFVVNKNDCVRYHVDNVLSLVTDHNCEIIRLTNETKGAACSALMAVDYIDSDDKLIITNSDQIIDVDLNEILASFDKRNLDAGVVCFNTVHPRWSFVRTDEHLAIIEAAEKRPISNKAIAGFYYFKKGSMFVEAAMASIEKGASVDGIFYVAPVINELILKSMNLGIYEIDNSKYHTFYSPQKIEEFETRGRQTCRENS